jgi:hypothetical protein
MKITSGGSSWQPGTTAQLNFLRFFSTFFFFKKFNVIDDDDVYLIF